MTTNDHPPPDRPPHPDLEDFDRRLTARLKARQAREGRPSASVHAAAGGLGLAMRMSLEFVAAVGVGTFLGAGIDHLAGSGPWGLLVGLGLGFAAGVRGVVQTAMKMQGAAAPTTPPGAGSDAERGPGSKSGTPGAEAAAAAEGKDEAGRGE